jgi:eukaryotic-like serine/threonine-protein kinase
MGVVYDARHRTSGARAALKTVRAPRKMSISGIRREIHALASVSHPGIVRVLDHGVHLGLPWYAMEYLEGDDLFSWAGTPRRGQSSAPGSDAHIPTQQLNTGTLPAAASAEVFIEPFLARVRGEAPEHLRPILTVVRRLCEGLEFVHGMGIVHRDLKPENLIVRPDGMPVIVDFGLMSRFSSRGDVAREAVQATDTLLAGTVFYVAPEQIRGEFVDARADLYALGCILYELLTGSPPFDGQAPDIMQQHLEAAPPRACDARDGVPDGLDELIGRLMAKRPEERFGHATDVARALVALGAVDAMPEPCPPARSFLYRPILTGRDAEVRSVHGRLRAAKDGRGGMQFLGGVAGVGKTRLAMEMVRDAKLAGFRVMTGECVRFGPPLHPFAPALRAIADYCLEAGPAETHRLLRDAEILAAFDPSVGRVLGANPADDEPETNRPLPTGRQNVIDVLWQVFARLSETMPLLLLLDDVHLLDELSLEALLDWARGGQLPTSQLMILGTYRSDVASGRLPELLGAPTARQVVVSNLDQGGVGQMVAGMLALPDPPRNLVAYLAGLSKGNPFFVAEYLIAAIGRGLLERDPRGAWLVSAHGPWASGVHESGSLGELVEHRMGGLTPNAAQVLKSMAVVGRQAEVQLVQDVAGIMPFDFYDAVAELVGRQILVEPEPGYLRFTHDQLREVALAGMEQEEARRCHGAAAASMSARRASLDPGRVGALARHWEQAGKLEEARDAYHAATLHAFRGFATEEAERLTLAYLRLVTEPTAESVRARLQLGHLVYIQHGRLEEAREQCRAALLEAREIGALEEEAQALRRLAHCARIIGEMEEAQTYGKAAAEACARLGSEKLRGRALQTLGNIYHDMGDLELARQTFVEALEMHRACDDEWSEGFTQINLGLVDVSAGRHAVGRSRYERALTIFEDCGDLRGMGLALHNLSTVLYWHERNLPAALKAVDRATEVAGRSGNRRQQTISLAGSARMHLEMGYIDKARARVEEGIALAERMDARRGYCFLMLCRSEIARLVDHDLDAAHNDVAAAREWVFRLDLASLRFDVLAQLCIIAIARQEPYQAILDTLQTMTEAGVAARDEQSWGEVQLAVAREKSGEPLYWGSAPESLSPPLAKALARRDANFPT